VDTTKRGDREGRGGGGGESMPKGSVTLLDQQILGYVT